MADLTELKNIVRKGIVQSVDKKEMKARVKFGDKGGIISGELHILIQKRHIIPAPVESWIDGGVSEDIVKIAALHEHEAYITYWLPEVGDMVLCLMIPDGDGEGYILGGIK